MVSGDAQSAAVGASLAQALAVRVNDANGRAVPGAVVSFRVTSGGGFVQPAADTTDARGQAESIWTLGTSTAAESRVVVQVSGVTESVVFSAISTAAAPSSIEKLTEVGCALPGARDIAVRVLDRFANPVPQVSVSWAASGSGATLSANASTTGADGRATVRWTTDASAANPSLTGSVGSLTAVFAMRSPTARPLSIGQSVTLSATEAECNDFAASGSQYIVTVTNTTPNASSQVSFGLIGGLSTTLPTASAIKPVQVSTPAGRVRVATPEVRAARAEAAAHERLHRGNLQVVRQLAGVPLIGSSDRSFAISAPPPNVGDTLSIRMADPFALSCTSFLADIRARVVYAGARGIVLEDIAAPLAGTMDALYATVGRELDDVMWPILTTNFGNPLAFDAQLDANDRVLMVFSERVNRLPDLAGYVLSTDFYPRALCNSSNAGEVFYARVPTSSAPGFNGDTREDWLRRTRTVIIHEAKHLVSYSLAFAQTNGRPSEGSFEDRWLEESSAMLAEELWARRVFGYAQRGNTGYSASIFCEVRPANVDAPRCAGSPRSMYDHFLLLHDYEEDLEHLSPLGDGGNDDFTFYGSGWSFLRWAIDQYSTSEPAFLRQLTAEPALHGTANIEARTGRPFAELITDWTAAIVLDDQTGFTPTRGQLAMPSWNLPDIFRGLSSDFPGGFSATPLALRRASFGDFAANVSGLRGGTSAVFEISGNQPGREVLELRGPNGTPPSSALRLTVVRTR